LPNTIALFYDRIHLPSCLRIMKLCLNFKSENLISKI